MALGVWQPFAVNGLASGRRVLGLREVGVAVTARTLAPPSLLAAEASSPLSFALFVYFGAW